MSYVDTTILFKLWCMKACMRLCLLHAGYYTFLLLLMQRTSFYKYYHKPAMFNNKLGVPGFLIPVTLPLVAEVVNAKFT